MGEFAEKYGYGDSGECLTVGDAKEVWQFEIFGPGADRARRRLGGQAHPAGRSGRLGERLAHHDARPTTRTSRCTRRTSTTWPRSNGWWKKGEPFLFNRAFGMSGAPTPNRREWRVLSLLAPSLKLDPWAPEQPFSVKPDKKVTVARPDGDSPRRLRGHAVRPDEEPAGRPVRHAEPLVAAARLQAGRGLLAGRAHDRRAPVLLRHRAAGARRTCRRGSAASPGSRPTMRRRRCSRRSTPATSRCRRRSRSAAATGSTATRRTGRRTSSATGRT